MADARKGPSCAPLLQSMPWYSSFVTDEQNRLDLLPEDLKTTAQLLLAHYSEACSTQSLRNIFSNLETVHSRHKYAGPLVALLFGFRFLDIASMILPEGPETLPDAQESPVILPPPISLGRSPFDAEALNVTGISALHENGGWPEMLRAVQRQLLRPQSTHAPVLSVEEMTTSREQRLLYAAFRHLHTLHDRQDNLTVQKQLFNIESAVFFINWLMQGNKDLPLKTQELYEQLSSNARDRKVDLDFAKAFSSLKPALDVYRLRQPLFMALAISPLVLLCDIKAASCKTGRISLIKVWFHYGNMRPPVLRQVESLLWSELFSVARGVSTSSEALASFLTHSLPLLESAEGERSFFAPRAGIPQSPPRALSGSDGQAGAAPSDHPLNQPPEPFGGLSPDIDWELLASQIQSFYQSSHPRLITAAAPVRDEGDGTAGPAVETPTVSQDPTTVSEQQEDAPVRDEGDGTAGPTVETPTDKGEGDGTTGPTVETPTISQVPEQQEDAPVRNEGDGTAGPTVETPTDKGEGDGTTGPTVETPTISQVPEQQEDAPVRNEGDGTAGPTVETPTDKGDGTAGSTAETPTISQVPEQQEDAPVRNEGDGTADPAVETPTIQEPVVEPKKDKKRKRKATPPPATSDSTRRLRDKQDINYAERDYLEDAPASQLISAVSAPESGSGNSLSLPRFSAVSSKQASRVFGEFYLLPSVGGVLFTYQPAFYTKATVDMFSALIARCSLYQRQHGYSPRFTQLSGLTFDQSVLENLYRSTDEFNRTAGVVIIDSNTYRQRDQRSRVHIDFITYHIVVRGPGSNVEVTDSLLSTLGSTTCLRPLHDLSLRGNTDDVNSHIVSGSFNDFMSELKKGRKGKIVNFLDIPGTDDRFATPSVSSNIYSHRYTLGFHHFASLPNHVPVCDLYWHLVSSADADHPSHVDANGFATELYVETGAKLVILGFPNKYKPAYMARVDAFVDFAPDMTSPDSENVTGVLLLGGDPGSIDRSMWGIIHTLFRNNQITNQDHPIFHDLLVRIMIHWHDIIKNDWDRFLSNCQLDKSEKIKEHMPNLFTVHGLFQLFCLCNLMEFGTILVGDRYESRGTPFLAELNSTFGEMRDLAKECIQHLDCCICYLRKGGHATVSVSAIARSLLVQQSVALIRTAELAKHPHRTAKKVESFLEQDLARDSVALAEFRKIRGGRKVTYARSVELHPHDCDSFQSSFYNMLLEYWCVEEISTVPALRSAKRQRRSSHIEDADD
ncbi:hypothetical protein VNI00_004011 [Paramarasmius palmivorus]|uniref:Uncharacterized protein n=1 Tax=Paramarasmius palmivorus TaxID=297713 RepID=A0AAW0DPG7_9AGAR